MVLRNEKPDQWRALGVVMVLFGLELPAFLVLKFAGLCAVVAVWKFFEGLLGSSERAGLVSAQAQEVGQGEPAKLRDGRLHGGAAQVHDAAEPRGSG